MPSICQLGLHEGGKTIPRGIDWMKPISKRKEMAKLEYRPEHGNNKGDTEIKVWWDKVD